MAMTYKFEIEKRDDGKFWWQFKSPTGMIAADSHQGYTTIAGARRAAKEIKENVKYCHTVIEFIGGRTD